MKCGEYINYDLENSPLQIKTDSVVGSNDKVSVSFYKIRTIAGGVSLFFTSPPQYQLTKCSRDATNFPTPLPSETDKIWTITLSKTSGIRLMIHCNNKEVLNVVLSDNTCTSSHWSTTWNTDVEEMYFIPERDTASDYYRPGNLLIGIIILYPYLQTRRFYKH